MMDGLCKRLLNEVRKVCHVYVIIFYTEFINLRVNILIYHFDRNITSVVYLVCAENNNGTFKFLRHDQNTKYVSRTFLHNSGCM